MSRSFSLLVWLAVGLGVAIVSALVRPDDLLADESDQRVVRVGFVAQGSAPESGIAAFRAQLKELGYVEGRNMVIEVRFADGHVDRLPALMAEVVERKVDVIVTAGTPGAIAAKNATRSIPIVAAAMADPLRTGLVTSLARPDANLTGTSMGYSEELGGKWLELLDETVPRLRTVAVVANSENLSHRYITDDIRNAAPKRHLQLRMIDVHGAEALPNAFKQARQSAQAVLLLGDAVTLRNQQQVTSLAAKHRLPVLYVVRSFVDEGGLMAYAPDLVVQTRRAAAYVAKILKGARPADLPIEQPTRYELVINLRTAKALGMTIPSSILLRADQVIR